MEPTHTPDLAGITVSISNLDDLKDLCDRASRIIDELKDTLRQIDEFTPEFKQGDPTS